jgi:oxygen-independent coproporphyrinogen-3 oxidase
VNALLREIDLRRAYLGNERIETIYFGGGTPSLLSAVEIQTILMRLRATYTVAPEAEITLEANPDDISAEALQSWRSLGINRLSIGLQSFNEEELKWMNRAHNAAQSLQSVQLAQQYGFHNITIDLIYGSKFQSVQSWEQTLETTLQLGIQHISAYNLTVEERTRLGNAVLKGKEPDVNEDLSSAQFLLLSQVLRSRGFQHYEISNFALPGFEAQHNSNYWRQETYLGLGPSAHSFNGNHRQWNVRNNPQYIRSLENGELNFEMELLSPRDLYNEYVMTRLRTSWGCDLKEIEVRFGTPILRHFETVLKDYPADFIRKDQLLILNDSARLRADGIASAFFILEETAD